MLQTIKQFLLVCPKRVTNPTSDSLTVRVLLLLHVDLFDVCFGVISKIFNINLHFYVSSVLSNFRSTTTQKRTFVMYIGGKQSSVGGRCSHTSLVGLNFLSKLSMYTQPSYLNLRLLGPGILLRHVWVVEIGYLEGHSSRISLVFFNEPPRGP